MNKELIIEQIKTIASSGVTNMFDINTVREIAQELDFKELVELIDTDQGTYAHIIMHG